MDEIRLTGLQFYGRHGVFPEETALGQRFIVNVRIRTDLRQAGISDDVADSIDYGQVYECIRGIVEGQPVRLLERLAESISTSLLAMFPRITGVVVEVEKPGAPLPGVFGTVSVLVDRNRAPHHG